MTITTDYVVNIIRNVTGRVDASDPLFTNTIMIQYLDNFLRLESTQDIRLIKNKTYWEFDLGVADEDDPEANPNPYPVSLQNLLLSNGTVGASTIGPECWCEGFVVFWYQSPKEFFSIWPETQTYQPSRPTYVLYYNNELLFRNPPDQTYHFKLTAYQVELAASGTFGENDYLYRYAAYGTALNIFSDFGETDKWNEYFPIFQRYRALVYGRTYCQQQNQRPSPEF